MQPELIADYSCHTGENPLWHPLERRLYWTDIPRGRLYRYAPATGAHEECYRGDPVGGFTVQSDGALLLFMAPSPYGAKAGSTTFFATFPTSGKAVSTM